MVYHIILLYYLKKFKFNQKKVEKNGRKNISNWGLIILLLTLIIKTALSPLTFKSYMSQAKMRVLKPQIQAINDKYPGQEQAMMMKRKVSMKPRPHSR